MTESKTPRQYKDVAGNPVSLEWLTKNEPEWAANQIRHRDTLELELAECHQQMIGLRREVEHQKARVKAYSESEAKLREALRKIRNHQTQTGGSFKQWYNEITGMAEEALSTTSP